MSSSVDYFIGWFGEAAISVHCSFWTPPAKNSRWVFDSYLRGHGDKETWCRVEVEEGCLRFLFVWLLPRLEEVTPTSLSIPGWDKPVLKHYLSAVTILFHVVRSHGINPPEDISAVHTQTCRNMVKGCIDSCFSVSMAKNFCPSLSRISNWHWHFRKSELAFFSVSTPLSYVNGCADFYGIEYSRKCHGT